MSSKNLEASVCFFSLSVKYSGNSFTWKPILRAFSSNKADLQRSFSTLQYLQVDFTSLNLMRQKNVRRIDSCLRALNINYGRVPLREVSLYMFKIVVLTLHCGREQSYFHRYQHWTKKIPSFYSGLFSFTIENQSCSFQHQIFLFEWCLSVDFSDCCLNWHKSFRCSAHHWA